ncbi:hypothetical protein O3Q51_18285 [Cryomorphaceae bacterium 1068]|nr:hypothetical protein [Cryomorphaceae bacterium 1068]
MKTPYFKRRKFWRRALAGLVLLPLLLFGAALVYLYQNRDSIIQTEIATINQGYHGEISVGATHIAPFKNFPYLSIKVDDVKVMETKETDAAAILEVADIYVGLDLRDLLQGNIDIKKLLIEDGHFDMVLHKDGSDNLSNALAMEGDTTSSEPLHLHLKGIELKNIDIHKKDESNGLDVQTRIAWATGGFKSTPQHIAAHIDTEFELNIIKNGDTTYVKQKQFEFHTDLDFNESTGILSIARSEIKMPYADFELSGMVDTKNHMDLDLAIKGSKPNFDLFIAFAPEELKPILDRYENAGKIYFNAVVRGPSAFGYHPFFDVNFGASEAFLENTTYRRRIDAMGFEGHFTNGAERNPTTMQFSMENMTADLGEGDFTGAVRVKNFEAPEIEMSLDADFDLDFIAEFLNLTEYEDASGTVDLKMNFHDIIDLDHPERALSNLNQAYYSELTVKDLKVNSADLPAPLKSLNAHVVMRGQAAELDQFELKLGESDLSITGYLSDLPAILHQSPVPVTAHLDIQSKLLDVAELTGYTQGDTAGIDERIDDLSLSLSFASTARNLAVFNYLPEGEFFVDSLHARLKHYPHTLHDFHVDILVDESDLRIKDFTGYIDDSDFHLNGKVHDYAFWMQDTLWGDVDLDLGLESKRLRLEDLFAYQGENYVPEDYRHEEFDNLKLHLTAGMHYQPSGLQSVDVDLDLFDAKMHLHPMRFQNMSGHFHYEDEQLLVENFHGELGRTILNVDISYDLRTDSLQDRRENFLILKTNYIDFDQLTNFSSEPPNSGSEAALTSEDVAEHAEAFNVYELPFSDMTFDLDIGHFIYHRLDIQNIQAKLRTTEDHYLYVDTLQMKAAGGDFSMNGYFNGSDPEHIYLKPHLQVDKVDLDQLLFKFENFGQDAIVSENLHGQLSATVTGNIRVYPDFVPDLDQSEVHMDVMALNGRLENYDYMLMLSDYFGDKNLRSVRFDTLQNHLDVIDGVLTIPNMTIESTLGHMDISGKQDMDNNIEYYVRIPWDLVKKGAINRVFGSKKKEGEDQGEDEIVEVDPNENVRYLNLKITGTLDDFKIGPGKEKQKR